MQTRHLLLAVVLGTACYRSASSADTTAADSSVVVSAPAVVDSSARADSTSRADTTRQPVGGQLELRTNKNAYRSGEAMTLTLANPTSNSYTYNACSRILERESGGAWTLVQEQRMCTMIAHLLGPRSNRTEITELSGGLEPGRYRVVIALTEEAPGTAPQSTRATSAPFTVGG